MYHFWNGIILPVFRMMRPKTIVEVGCARGLNTANLLNYCKSVNGKLIVIDPAPQFDVEAVRHAYGDCFELIAGYSLEVLPSIGRYDAILLDGDHNWYTVYNELKQLERKASFPLVLLHDTEWPYARRDLYYFPESIPGQFRQPYAIRGIVQGVNELVQGGFNDSVPNALQEGGERNGVLTGIEDFLAETKLPLRFYRAFSQYGLGILAEWNDKPIGIYRHEMIKTIITRSGL